jgi:prepilin signal peptidase PulO-like enzyme (type II secretory pathway)
MGMGDAKLAAALSLLFGWPDIAIVTALAFLMGAIAGAAGMLRGRRTLKSFLPFGPFLALACAAVFFWGERIVEWYFWLIPLA